MRSLQIGYDPTVQQQKSLAVQISKLHSDGQITKRRIHTHPFDDVKERCCGSGVCTASKSSPQSTPRFTIYSTRKGHSQSVAFLSLTVALSYRLIKCTLSRLLMLEPVCLMVWMAPPRRPRNVPCWNN